MNIHNATTVSFGKRWYHRHAEMMGWCTDRLGEGGWEDWDGSSVWLITCNFGNTKFYFANPEDATAFTLHFGRYE